MEDIYKEVTEDEILIPAWIKKKVGVVNTKIIDKSPKSFCILKRTINGNTIGNFSINKSCEIEN